ncbi:phosphorylcholine transferase LicD [Fusobacterium sp. MFO224]|uniref:LicD family protein n=1 Tax=Fusobacterium sp. MFO224 TaxID=3378070 RepID=UPI003854E56F
MVRIAEKYELRYVLIAGTLLGAVRHAGFIPWDDDIDIALPRKDYEKLKSVMNKELSDKYYVHSIKNDKNYCWPYIKIRKHNTLFLENEKLRNRDHNGIFIDIFPLDKIKSPNCKKEKLKSYVIKKITEILMLKSGIIIAKNITTRLAKITIYNLWKITPILFKPLVKIREKLIILEEKRNFKYYCNLAGGYPMKKESQLISDIFPAKKLSFENREYYVPKNYKKYLKTVYGENYMKLPPVEKRIEHNPVEVKFN